MNDILHKVILNIFILDNSKDILSNIFIKNNNINSNGENIKVNNDNGNMISDIKGPKIILYIIDKKLIL